MNARQNYILKKRLQILWYFQPTTLEIHDNMALVYNMPQVFWKLLQLCNIQCFTADPIKCQYANQYSTWTYFLV